MNRPVTLSVPTTFKVREAICPGCKGEGRNTGRDEGGFYATGICEECEGRQVVDASCAGCDRIEPLDAEGFCKGCSDSILNLDVKLDEGGASVWL